MIARVLAAALAVVLVACSGDDPATLPSTPADATTPVTADLVEVVEDPDDPDHAAASTVGTPTTEPTPTSAVPATEAPTATLPPTTQAPTTAAPPTTVVPSVDAKAWVVYDTRTGTTLTSHEADARLPVGSVMKLLTAQTAYAAGQPTRVVKAPPGLILDPAESRIGINEGQELPRDLLIRAMLIVSANDAARMLAIDIAGGEPQFAELMNQQAASLGLANTHAVNATGLDADGQYASAADMTRLAAHLMGNQTFQLTVARRDATLNGQTLPATNDLLRTYAGADGVKTGRTTAAGWCIVASATRENRRIIVTVLGAPTEAARDAAATTLLDWAFAQPL
jgi:D-alanyl-D-alanine carboxypeptidase (penicillin-binding protein 5/6)